MDILVTPLGILWTVFVLVIEVVVLLVAGYLVLFVIVIAFGWVWAGLDFVWQHWKEKKPHPEPNPVLRKQAFLFVGGIYFLTLCTIFVLSQFAPVKAHFDAILKEFGGSITVAASGILGAFLAIFVIAVIAVRYLSR